MSAAPPEEEAPAMVAPQLVSRPATVPPPPAPISAPTALPSEPRSNPGSVVTGPAPLPFADGPLGEEANPDDFQFGDSAAASSAPPVAEAAAPGVAEPMMGGATDANPFPPAEAAAEAPDPFAE